METIRYCQKHKGLEVCAYGVMSSHVHMIIGRNSGPNLQGIMRDIKKYTSVKILEAIRDNPQESRKDLFLWLFERAGNCNENNTTYQLWQQGSHAVELSSDKFVYQKLEYIHNNPVMAGWVAAPEDYLYSSAVNYAGLRQGIIDVILI